jgi:hypothetical protein
MLLSGVLCFSLLSITYNQVLIHRLHGLRCQGAVVPARQRLVAVGWWCLGMRGNVRVLGGRWSLVNDSDCVAAYRTLLCERYTVVSRQTE